MKKIFDCLRKNPYTSFVYETIQLFSSMSVGIFNSRESYLLRPPKFQWPRFAINALKFRNSTAETSE